MLSANSYSTVGFSMYTFRAGRRVMNLTGPGPEPFEDELEAVILDELETDACPNGQKTIEETGDAA